MPEGTANRTRHEDYRPDFGYSQGRCREFGRGDCPHSGELGLTIFGKESRQSRSVQDIRLAGLHTVESER